MKSNLEVPAVNMIYILKLLKDSVTEEKLLRFVTMRSCNRSRFIYSVS